jgi:hypothetical protein
MEGNANRLLSRSFYRKDLEVTLTMMDKQPYVKRGTHFAEHACTRQLLTDNKLLLWSTVYLIR